MADLSKNHVKYISGFTKDQFDTLVKNVIQEYWKIDLVVITDGKGDGGIDIKTFSDRTQKKIPIQVTVDKSIYKKLKSDIAKISESISKYDYESTFYFFYSGNPEEGKIEDLKALARQEYGITLEVFDAKYLGALAESPKYPRIRAVIRELLGNFLDNDSLSMSQFDKMKFDLIVHGGDASDIRQNIIRGYILYALCGSGPMSKDELFNKLEKHFESDIDKAYCAKQVAWLATNQKLLVDQKEVRLTDAEKLRIESVQASIQLQEQYFMQEVRDILKSYSIDIDGKLVAEKILDIYTESYGSDLNEVLEDVESSGVESVGLKALKTLFDDRVDDTVGEEIIRSLIKVGEGNNYLQRVSAGIVFSDLSSLPHIENYIRRQPKSVYLDTSVLLYIFCIYLKESKTFNNVYYNSVIEVLNYSKTGDIKVALKTTKNYVREVAFQLLQAYKLAEFSELKYFNELGSTSNVFYIHYLNLEKNAELEDGIYSFKEFLSNFGVKYENNEARFLNYLAEFVETLFEQNGIDVIDVSQYEFTQPSKKVFEEIRELFLSHQRNTRPRPDSTIKNDSLMFVELFRQRSADEIEPTILTWDNWFSEIRKKYHHLHPKAAYWHLFRPSRFIDHLSLIKLNLNPKTLNLDILSIMEGDFNMHDKVRHLKDVWVRIIKSETLTGVRFYQEIAELRNEYIFRLHVVESGAEERDVVAPIDEVLFSANAYYQKKVGEFDIDEFKELINDEKLSPQVIELWRDEAVSYAATSEVREVFFTAMDDLIRHKLKGTA